MLFSDPVFFVFFAVYFTCHYFCRALRIWLIIAGSAVFLPGGVPHMSGCPLR